MKIAIIGTGYVGLVTGTCLAELGNSVICADIDQNKIKRLKNGQIPIYEPGLEELVIRNCKEKRLEFTINSAYAIKNSDIVFSAVGTPPNSDGSADISNVLKIAETFAQSIGNDYKIFVNKSTVPVGTSFILTDIIKRNSNSSAEFDVVDNPEFLREGCAVKDFMSPDRIIVGIESERAKKIMARLYQSIVRAGNVIIFTDIASAEIIKYASNAFLAMKISFINEIANFCEQVGADVKEVARGIGLDRRIGPQFLHAGIGYGGSCFPKDIKAFIQTAKQFKQEFKILPMVEEINQNQKRIVVDKLLKKIPNLSQKKIAIWGLSFKPKTDDMREAPSITIINELIKYGAIIQTFDPVAIPGAKKIFSHKNITYFNEPYGCLFNADALLILTEWDEFRSADIDKIKKIMNGNIIIDGRNIHDPQEMIEKGIDYEGIGRKKNINYIQRKKTPLHFKNLVEKKLKKQKVH